MFKGSFAASAYGLIGLVAVGAVLWPLARRHETPMAVVLVTLDTTRADRLSPYGNMDIQLPTMERLASEGVLFEQVTTPVPLTLPAHTTLLTGFLPPNHGVRDNADAPLTAATPTLATVLQSRGYRTGAFVGSVVLDANRGLARGFDVYRGVPDASGQADASGQQRRADLVIDDAVAWMDSVGASPFFLWTHLYDAHRPYDPPEPFRNRYAHDLYLGEIAFLDSQIGRLIDALERRGALSRTVIVLTADHGESLGEHGERDHGVFLYESVLHVPLIIRAPGLMPARVQGVVRLSDLMPTVLDLLHLPAMRTDGVSLARAGARPQANLAAYAESLYPERLGWSPLRALREGRFKFIEAPRPELYDLDEDRFELTNLYDTRRDVADAMRVRLSSLSAADGQKVRSEASPDVIRNLRSLGYVAGAAVQAAARATPLPDPKDCIGFAPDHADLGDVFRRCGPFSRVGRR